MTGDLGTTAKEVEKALETNFALANRWGCILLLDEADVFLAERTKEDFKRNGLVAGKLKGACGIADLIFASISPGSRVLCGYPLPNNEPGRRL